MMYVCIFLHPKHGSIYIVQPVSVSAELVTMMAKLSEPPHEMTTKAKLAVWSQEIATALTDFEPFGENLASSFSEFASAGKR